MSVFRDLLQNFSVCTCSQEMLEDILTYRTKWTDFSFCDSAMDYEISSDGTLLRIYKVSPNFSVAWSNLENPSNVTLADKFANWKIHISGVQEKRNNIFTYRTHGTWGGPNYSGRGLVFSPSNQGGNSLYINSYPWDLNVQNGSLKNPNEGWASYGYTVDGQQNVFNITAFPERPAIGTEYQMTMAFVTGTYGVGFAGDWGLNNTAYGTQYNNYKFGITRRTPSLTDPSAIWHTGTNDAFQIEVTGLKEGEGLRFKESTTNVILAYFDSDGIYTIPAYSGSNITALAIDGNLEETSEVIVRYIADGLDENGMIDFSDSPIDLRVLPTNDVIPLWRQECWECVDNRGVTHKKDMTVENCLKKYYGGTDYTNPDYILYYRDENNVNHNNVAINRIEINPDGLCTELFGGYDRDTEPYYEYPPLEEISDLNNYSTFNLSVKATYQPSADAWADWLNEHIIKYNYIRTADSPDAEGVLQNYPIYSWHLINSEEHPVIINIKYEDYPATAVSGFITLNNVTYDAVGITGKRIYSGINYLKINYVGTSGRITVMQDTFTNSYIGHLEVTHNNELINPEDYGIRPVQFINTFAWQSGFDTLPEHGIGIGCYNSEYMFDWNSTIKAINTPGHITPCYGGIGYAADNQGQYRWPCPIIEGVVTTDVPCYAYQTFANATNLETIVPVIDVKWCWDGSNTTGLYKFFANNNKLTSVRISHINCGDWDFADTNGNFYLPNIDADSIKYIFDNAEDLVGIPFNPDNVIEGNVPKYVTDGATYDYVNIRSSKSVNGLNIYCPETWRDKITSEMIASINAKGWTVYIGGTVATA